MNNPAHHNPPPTEAPNNMTRNTTTPSRQSGPALEAMYQLAQWLIPTLDRFPRSQKFLLGDRIQTTAVICLEALTEATFTRDRTRILKRVNIDLDKLRLLLRLAKDLSYLDRRRYEYAARRVDEVGRLVGGWQRTHHAAAN